VSAVDEISMTHMNVISQDRRRFLCELEFHAQIEAWLEIEVETREWDGEEDHEGFDELSTTVTHLGVFSAEVQVLFDGTSPENASFEHVQCSTEIEIDASEIDELRRYMR
jgi:hypothetical protein